MSYSQHIIIVMQLHIIILDSAVMVIFGQQIEV